ncbi:galactose-1-phosphate uridylyltransferase [Candidatus Woesearchaeota archaeon]|nr:galactose-1-phosphate uridylyltransferase [Candidatus Woesearchaeota archaeon]
MNELRKDYILDRWVIVSASRGKRPHEFVSESKKKEGTCFFCPGNEKFTPPEIGRLPKKDMKGWKMRWFANKFAAVEPKGETKASKKPWMHAPAYGYHEIIVESDDHDKQLADLPAGDIKQLLDIYDYRINELGRKKGVRYVQVFKNHGREGGTSLIHTHTQVTAISMVPPQIKEKLEALKRVRSRCAYCDIIKKETRSARKVINNKHVAAFCPYASRFHYETWVFPKRHVGSLSELDSREMQAMAKALKHILVKLDKLNAPYNYYLHYSPESAGKKDKFHMHIEITPRMATFAGFEYSTGITINSLSPESAAMYLR